MKKFEDKSDELNISSNVLELYFKKCIKQNKILFYNRNDLIDVEYKEDCSCPICLDILNNPVSCSNKNNSHSFCKECIDKYLKNNNKCPSCKLNFEYKNNDRINNILKELSFNCMFKSEGCNEIILYSEYLNHINNCEHSNNYECYIKKYNYNKKKFEKCGFVGGKKNLEKHFKKCGAIKYKCIICNKYILLMNLEEHVENECIFGIINYPNGNKYLGAKYNNMREGYGTLYFSNGNKYEGEFIDDKIEGFGIFLNENKIIYKGEFKNNNYEGYGIYYYINGNRYEGQWKNDAKKGYGIFYYKGGDKYMGNWINDCKQGYGIMNYSNGNIYEGEWENDEYKNYKTYNKKYGIFYYLDGSRYKGEWYKNNDIRNGYGINYYSNGDRYEGDWQNNYRKGYGIYYYSNGDRYEGEWRNNIKDGYGIYYYPNGDRYEGEFKNDKIEGCGIYYYSDGAIYKGDWKNNFSEGNGIYIFSNGDRYEGEFKNDIINGYGIFYFFIHKEIQYKGYFENGNSSFKILYFLHEATIILNKIYSMYINNKIILLFIIILIIGIIMKLSF